MRPNKRMELADASIVRSVGYVHAGKSPQLMHPLGSTIAIKETVPKSSDVIRLIVAVALGSGVPRCALAQADPNHRCWAPQPSYSERTDWYDADGRFVNDTNTLSTVSFVRKLAGTYRLVVVTSEGTIEKEVAEYKLKLEPPTQAQGDKIRQIGAVAAGRLQVPLIAILEYRRGAVGRRTVTDRSRADLSGEVNLEYWPATGKIGFNVGLAMDSGTLFHVTSVNEHGQFSGRWEDGGYVAIQVSTPIEPLLEHLRGYFCAFPKASRRCCLTGACGRWAL